MSDIHEKIGELRGQMDGMVLQQTQIRNNITKLFDKIDQGHSRLTEEIKAAAGRPCRKEEEFVRINLRCETAVKQAARVHTDTKPVIEDFNRRRQSRTRKLYERSEVRVLVVGAFFLWMGAQVVKGVTWLYEHVAK